MVPRQPALHGDLLQASRASSGAAFARTLAGLPVLELYAHHQWRLLRINVAVLLTPGGPLPAPSLPQLLGRALTAMGNTNHDMAKGFLSIAVQVRLLRPSWVEGCSCSQLRAQRGLSAALLGVPHSHVSPHPRPR